MIDFEKAKELFNTILMEVEKKKGSKTFNEAEVRFYLIDEILKILGWEKSNIKVELYKPTNGYTDYELISDHGRLVLEAKREDKSFILPVSNHNKEKYKIETLFDLSEDIEKAIEQTFSYCQYRGIEIGCVSNGYQFVFFLGSRTDGISPIEGDAIVFHSLDFIKNNFYKFWDFLSYDAVSTNNSRLLNMLLSQKIQPPPEKLSAKLVVYPGYKNRNLIANELQILGGLFLEDLTYNKSYEEDFVRSTYCASGAYSQHAMLSKAILQSRYSLYLQNTLQTTVKPIRSKKGIVPELTEDLFAAEISRRPIILLGDVGIGKTMFIKNLIHVEAKEILESSIVLYLNFGKKPSLVTDLYPFILDELELQLDEKYNIDIFSDSFIRGVYHLELLKFQNGIYKNKRISDPDYYETKELDYLQKLLSEKESHLKKCFNHIVRGRKKQIVVFFDNVDQRPTEFQEQVFLTGQTFAAAWPVTVFISLRPETFLFSKSKGYLAAYQPRVFSIMPPRVDRVLAKRLEWSLEILKNKGRLTNFPSFVQLSSLKLEQYIQMLVSSLNSENEITVFIENMSNGNIRKAIDFLIQFMGSGHVDSMKILDIIAEQGQYILPIHEFLRAVLYSDNEYYKAADSPIINIFDILNDNPKEHFLIPLLISVVKKNGNSGGNEGFIDENILVEILHKFGFTDKEIQNSLHRVAEKGLIIKAHICEDNQIKWRVSSSGVYTILKLPTYFSYMDAIVVDTPICDKKVRDKIADCTSIEDRIKREIIFLDYLECCWDSKMVEYYDFNNIVQQARTLISKIEYRVCQNYKQ